MELAVVGAGFGRTGTLSFKLALEQLGFGPCYHQTEAWRRPAHRHLWIRAVAGETIAARDWRQLLAGFRATSDWPACSFWREIRAAHPSARVVLLHRDPDEWYESMTRTILPAFDTGIATAPEARAWRDAMRRLIVEHDLGGHIDRAGAITALRAYEADVIASVPRAELLVYEVADGWGPLCGFLGVDAPDTELPHTNSTEQFRQQFGLDRPSAGSRLPG